MTEYTSKYFASKTGMDESLSDFKEPKKSIRHPKNTQSKSSGSKTRTKKATKKIRGQKDIRTALNSRKNELLSYNKDFEAVCRQSGIDVDAEQLQVAIALSKSLKDSKSAESSDPLFIPFQNTQEKIGKIRKTLLEYGFKVPEIKINITSNKRSKQHLLNSKLLRISETERKQIIVDRYTEVLFENVTVDDVRDNVINSTKVPLYHIATNIEYEMLKIDKIFYVENLIEPSPNSVGSLLRNWSEIPGRPLSPTKPQKVPVHIQNLNITQDEFDIVLSGTLNNVHEIIDRKMQEMDPCEKKEDITDQVKIGMQEDHDSKKSTIFVAPLRCVSPDLFEDELPSVLDATKIDVDFQDSDKSSLTNQSQSVAVNGIIDKVMVRSDDIMDLTENVHDKSPSFKSQDHKVVNSKKDYAAQIKPDDFMEISNYLAIDSQQILQKIQVNIDLTQKSNEAGTSTDCTPSVDESPEHLCIIDKENIDLTQSSSNSNETLVLDESSKSVIVDVDDIHKISQKNDNILRMDLTQSSNSNDDTLPFVQVGGKKHVVGMSRVYHDVLEETKEEINASTISLLQGKSKVDPVKNSSRIRSSKSSKECSSFEEYDFEHSYHNSTEIVINNKSLPQTFDDYNMIVKDSKEPDIDLTQNSYSSDEIVTNANIVQYINELDKRDDVSLHCVDICVPSIRDHVNSAVHCTHSIKNYENNDSDVLLSNGNDYNEHLLADVDSDKGISNEHNETSSSSIKTGTTEVHLNAFEISDEELDYSMHQARDIKTISNQNSGHAIENFHFDFGGISIMDNISGAQIDLTQTHNFLNATKCSIRKSLSDSFLPFVDIKGSCKVNIKSPEKACSSVSTPLKYLVKENIVTAKTPLNGEYIIKTDQVTPMQDFAVMSTPQRNLELGKYGLKPFKRKRAIQLLTHLYNQTHPVVEQDCETTPSKKIKYTEFGNDTSPSKIISPKKSIATPKKNKPKSPSDMQITSNKDKSPINLKSSNVVSEDDNNDLIYAESNDTPDLREIACHPEDWVFQKREKAKVHSCRVPLHIAFHNYVASRRRLRESILRYEPVNIDLIHRDLAASGHRYDPKDLLRHLDKKCITVKTTSNNARNSKKTYTKS